MVQQESLYSTWAMVTGTGIGLQEATAMAGITRWVQGQMWRLRIRMARQYGSFRTMHNTLLYMRDVRVLYLCIHSTNAVDCAFYILSAGTLC